MKSLLLSLTVILFLTQCDLSKRKRLYVENGIEPWMIADSSKQNKR